MPPVYHGYNKITHYAYFQKLKNYLGTKYKLGPGWLNNCYFTSGKGKKTNGPTLELTKVKTNAATAINVVLQGADGYREAIYEEDLRKWFYNSDTNKSVAKIYHSFYSYADGTRSTIFGHTIPEEIFKGFYDLDGSSSVPGNSSSGGDSTASPCQPNDVSLVEGILGSAKTLAEEKPTGDIQKHLLTLAETRGQLLSLNCPTAELTARRSAVYQALSQRQNELINTLRVTTETQIEKIIAELMERCHPLTD